MLLLVAPLYAHAQLPARVSDALTAAVAQGDKAATLARAELVVAGELPGDDDAARATLNEAAQSGSAEAAYVLGVLAYRARDMRAAQTFWQQAAAAGKLDAHYNLGLLLARDPAQQARADAEFEAAARARHVLACFALGTRLAGRDGEAARPWLECAAAQGYAPAQFNLAAVHARAAKDADQVAAARRWYAAAAASFAPAADALAALPAVAPPELSDPPATTALALRDADWVMSQRPEAYTVQIASGLNGEVLAQLLQRNLREGVAACVHERPGTRQAYSAIVGVYPDRVSAERASAALPAALRANGPWVRRYSALQQALRDADKMAGSGVDAHAVSN